MIPTEQRSAEPRF